MDRHDLWTEDSIGQSTLLMMIVKSSRFSMSFVLNVAPIFGAYESHMGNILAVAIGQRSTTEVKLLLRRLSNGLLRKCIDSHCPGLGTPLNRTATLPKVKVINLLLDAGAQIDLEGSKYGTPLMAACATGRLAAVKVLVARGAKTSYVKDGQVYGAFAAAKYHPQVRRWLLVGRFMEGPRLLTCG